MKTRATIDAIGFVTVVGVLTAGVAAMGIVQVAAAGIDLLVVAPFARRARTINAKAPVLAVVPSERIERQLPQAA